MCVGHDPEIKKKKQVMRGGKGNEKTRGGERRGDKARERRMVVVVGGAGRDAQMGRRGPVICSEWQFGGCVFCNAAIQV